MRPLGAQRYLAVQEKQRHVELGIEGEAEAFPLRLCVRNQEVPLRMVPDGVVPGTDRLDERVVGLHSGVGIGGNEARHDGEAQLRIRCCRGDLTHVREKENVREDLTKSELKQQQILHLKKSLLAMFCSYSVSPACQ